MTTRPLRARKVGGPTNASPRGVMLLGRDRIAYLGLVGRPSEHLNGALTVYVSMRGAFTLATGSGDWQTGELALVPPYTPHRISSEDRVIGILQLEGETLDPAALPPELTGVGVVARPALLARLKAGFAALAEGTRAQRRSLDVDDHFLERRLPPRALEPRIAAVVARIKASPCEPLDADSAAALVGLSRSRFLHLFNHELGTTFRRFLAWKRARSLLAHVVTRVNLSDLALEVGYPDSTHFSHSIRTFFGLTPKDIFSGSRRLAVILLDEAGAEHAPGLPGPRAPR